MNELERQLTQALTELGEQYERDMKRLNEQNAHLHKQVNSLSGQVQTLSTQVKELDPFLRNLAASMVDLGLMKSPKRSSGS